jgi:hypothetical protein
MAKTKHHLWYPRFEYRGGTEKVFRNLPCNIILLDDRIHRLIHQYSMPPDKPNHNQMAEAINRHKTKQCSCYTEIRKQ